MAEALAQYAEAIHNEITKYFTQEETQVIESTIFPNIFTHNDDDKVDDIFLVDYDLKV
jgi:hypothetical protein